MAEEPKAIEFAERLFTCRCGEADCTMATLVPFREHIAMLVRAITSAGHNGLLKNRPERWDAWQGVFYPLQMAASIEDVDADPSYTDDTFAGFWCEGVWELEAEDCKSASAYVAALTIFNFIWMAYEQTIRLCEFNLFHRDKLPVQARKYFAANEGTLGEMPAISYLYRQAIQCCRQASGLAEDIVAMEQTYSLQGAAAAAELGRIFRNYIVHGSDPVPPDDRANEWGVARFYMVSRMVLVLIQGLVRQRLKTPQQLMPLSAVREEDVEEADRLFGGLHQKPDLWRQFPEISEE
jgi:hypothetical protein